MNLPAYQLLNGDALGQLCQLDDDSVQTVVTSPPYYRLRSYLPDDHPRKALELGQEERVEDYVSGLVDVFEDVARVLKPDGTLWLNLGDTYASGGNGGGGSFGKKNKAWTEKQTRRGWPPAPAGLHDRDLIGIPWRVAFALQSAGWILRGDNIWFASNKAPEGNLSNRMTRKHEYVFLLARRGDYFFNLDGVRERCLWKEKRTEPIQYKGKSQRTSKFRVPHPSGKNPGTVWSFKTECDPDEHFAMMPEAVARRCVLAGSRPGDTVLDPFAGSGTTGAAALKTGRSFIGIDLNPDYLELARRRLDRCSTGLTRAEQRSGQGVLFRGPPTVK